MIPQDLILKQGDIVGVQGKSPFSKGILFATRSIGEKPSRISHVGMVTYGGTWKEAKITESLQKVVERPISDYEGVKIIIYRTDLHPDDVRILMEEATKFRGKVYPWLDIACHLGDFFLNGAYFFRRLAGIDNYGVCSWLVAWCYKKIHITFGKEVAAIQPDDIDDWCLRYKSGWTVVMELTKV